jgi:hypothetical protein
MELLSSPGFRGSGQPQIARAVSLLSGVRVNRIRFGSFVAASAFSGVGAVVTVAAIGSYNATTSDSYLLLVLPRSSSAPPSSSPAGSTPSTPGWAPYRFMNRGTQD